MFEVEQKFRLVSPKIFLATLAEQSTLKVFWEKCVIETDTYFQHPVRNFVVTDEALRIRRHLSLVGQKQPENIPETAEAECLITYKGPRLDRETKIRKELELPLSVRTSLPPEKFEGLGVGTPVTDMGWASSTLFEHLDSLLEAHSETSVFRKWEEMLTLLGFRAVRNVCKMRYKAWSDWQGMRVEFSFDIVPPIGTFVELEFLAENEACVPIAKEKLLSLSAFLNLNNVEPLNYLTLLENLNQSASESQLR